MAAVPQTTLTWLWGVLTKNHYDPKQTYRDPNRTYHDIARALAQYPSLGPRTDVYTYENGTSALLLHLVGTLPISFRGAMYNIPVDVWIPNTYPLESPMVYVTPAADMVVRLGQHVTLEGRVYHHYLAHWAEAWDRVSIVDLFGVLREIFAREPPVKARAPAAPTQPQLPVQQERSQAGPPPIPSLPPELSGSPSGVAQISTQVQRPSPIPPQVPPKPDQSPQVHSPPPPPRTTGPAAPPLPPKGQTPQGYGNYTPQNGQAEGPTAYAIQRQSSLRTAVPQQSHIASGRPNQTMESQPVPGNFPPQAHDATYMPQPGQVLTPSGQFHPPLPSHSSQQPPSLQNAYQPQYPPQNHQAHYRQVSQQSISQTIPQPRKPQTPDLLTSPFDVELPSIAPTGPPPPVPPNPQKDALLHTLSQTLTENLQSNVSQSRSAVVPLQSQAQALHTALGSLQGEIASLNNFQATLQSNIGILQQSLHRADTVIADAKVRISQGPTGAPAGTPIDSGAAIMNTTNGGLPPIDDVLVAPTVVGKQLYDLVTEERGIQQAIYALQAALVKGIIGADTWSRHTRSLAREAFIKRALIRKIGTGMRLDVGEGVVGSRLHS